MAEHTPGPWIVTGAAKFHGAPIRWSVWSDEVSEKVADELREPDAYLIAAAPELLEALEDLLTYDETAAKSERARAAIAKARGES